MVVMAENSVYHKSNHNQDAPSDHLEGGNPAVVTGLRRQGGPAATPPETLVGKFGFFAKSTNVSEARKRGAYMLVS